MRWRTKKKRDYESRAPIGRRPVNISLQGYYNVERPDLASRWVVRFQIRLLFPKKG